MLNARDMLEAEILDIYLRQQKIAGQKAHRSWLTGKLDRVLALREHEREIPIDVYLAELERLWVEVKSL